MFCIKKNNTSSTLKVIIVSVYQNGKFRDFFDLYVKSWKIFGFDVVLIIQSNDLPLNNIDFQNISNNCDEVWLRNNKGYDFGAWSNYFINSNFLEGKAYDRLFLTNDSLIGPFNYLNFYKVVNFILESDFELTGLTANASPQLHLQSYFLCFYKKLIDDNNFQVFFKNVINYNDISKVTLEYEIPLTTLVSSLGYSVGVLFPNITYSDQTIFNASQLISNGFPFLKRKCLNTHKNYVDLKSVVSEIEMIECDSSLLNYIRSNAINQ